MSEGRNMADDTDHARELAEAHVDWWLGSVRQLLIDNFVHGHKHGKAEEAAKATPAPIPWPGYPGYDPVPYQPVWRPFTHTGDAIPAGTGPVSSSDGPHRDSGLDNPDELAGRGDTDLHRDGEGSGNHRGSSEASRVFQRGDY